jgi:hypothetical protein
MGRNVQTAALATHASPGEPQQNNLKSTGYFDAVPKKGPTAPISVVAGACCFYNVA